MNMQKFFKKIRSPRNHQYFTLIELLIVITLVGLLAGLIIVNVNSARIKSYDSQRKADLNIVQLAVDAYASKNGGKYPATFSAGSSEVFRKSNANPTNWVPNPALPFPPFMPDYIGVLPKDPKNDANFYFAYASDGQDYKLEAIMESDTGKKWAEEDGGINNTKYEIFTGGAIAWVAPPPTPVIPIGWSPLDRGFNDWVNDIIVFNGDLIAGGNFTVAGDTPVNHIAKWNGSSWSEMGTGVEVDFLPGVFTIYNGELFVGGATGIPPAMSGSLAKWNGSSWSNVETGMGTGMSNYISAMTVYNGELVVGGDFTTAGGVSASRIAKWNGSSWSSLGSGMNGIVTELFVYNNELISGGQFTTAGGVSASRIAKWNGSSWSSLGSGMSGGINDKNVGVLVAYNNELIAGGDFTIAGGVSASRIAKWNGTSWSAFGSGVSAAVHELLVYNGELIAGGFVVNYIAKWDGSAWSTLGNGLNYRVIALAVYNNDLIAGGAFGSTKDGQVVNYIARWHE